MIRKTWIEYDRSRLVLQILVSGWAKVVWNIFNFPIYWVANHPNWLSYFSEGNHQPVLNYQWSWLVGGTNHPEWAVHIWLRNRKRPSNSPAACPSWAVCSAYCLGMHDVCTRIFKRKVHVNSCKCNVISLDYHHPFAHYKTFSTLAVII